MVRGREGQRLDKRVSECSLDPFTLLEIKNPNEILFMWLHLLIFMALNIKIKKY